MLVISRKEGETIVVPDIGLTIQILQTSSGNVKIGLQAPRDVKILRGELHPHGKVSPPLSATSQVAEASRSYSVAL